MILNYVLTIFVYGIMYCYISSGYADEMLNNCPPKGMDEYKEIDSNVILTEQDLARLDAGLTWEYCGLPPEKKSWKVPLAKSAAVSVEISADGAEFFRLKDLALLRGNVVANRGNQHVESELVIYERALGIICSPGITLLTQPEIRILGSNTEVSLLKRQAKIKNANYRLIGNNVRGTADEVFIENNFRSHYRNVTYTTCPKNNEDWLIRAEQLEVDRQAGHAIAHDVQLRIADVPVLYTPYLSLLLDDRRKSGFLLPSIGNSSRLGLDLRSPYYWNIDPQLDATFTPRIMSQRGMMLGSEVRYLTANDVGNLRTEIVPKDQQHENDSVRGKLEFTENGSISQRLTTEVDFNLVSDNAYLEDFGDELRLTSIRQLERRMDVLYSGDDWHVLGRMQGFQTVDRTIASKDLPYNRLPQLLFGTNIHSQWGLDLGLLAENVYFQHSDSDMVHGNRLALHPSMSFPLRRPYGHLIPKVSLNYASYWLTDQEPSFSSQPSSTIPTFSLDTGLELERNITWLQHSVTQTLEPRIYYLYTPYYDQKHLPVFDSAELDFSFISLFEENRFTGRDRIGDANQVTLGLTTRILSDAMGWELMRASVGEVLYFSDRRVQLAGVDEVQSGSAMVGELAARINQDWSWRVSTLWDPHRGGAQLRKSAIGVHYNTPQKQLLNLNYRMNETDLNDNTSFEDTELSFRWPVYSHLELVGRWLYSLRHNQTMEAFGGVQYGSCCWKIRGVVRNFVSDTDQESNLSFMLQVELSGLGKFGNNIESFLERGIYGYEVE